jgi:hypothetical protein
MGRVTWRATIASKRFYVLLYRKLGTILVASLIFNFVLSFVATRLYFDRPDPRYYSTNGATPPVGLSVMTAPNESSVPLLASDPEKAEGDVEKVVPE